MKTAVKAFVTGILIATVGVSAVSASEGIKSAVFNSNKVVLDDTALTLVGQRMISVVKDGEQNASNYMPVRGILEAMGYTVDWDAAQNAVVVTTPKYERSIPEPPDLNETIEPTKELLDGCWVAVDFRYDSYYDQGDVLKFYFNADKEFANYAYYDYSKEEEYISGSYFIDKDMLIITMKYEGYEEEQYDYDVELIQCRFSKDRSRMYLIDSYSDNIITLVKDDGAEFVGKVDGFAAKGIKSAVYNTNKVILDGKELDLGGQPMISVVKEGEQNASNYMPVRGVLEAMGYTVDWDGDEQAVIVNKAPAPKPNTDEALSPTKELLDGYWVVSNLGVEVDYYNYGIDSIKFYFDTDGKFAMSANIFVDDIASGTYSLDKDILSMSITYFEDSSGKSMTLTDDESEFLAVRCWFSKDGSRMYFGDPYPDNYDDSDYYDYIITLVKDAGEGFKKYQQ